MCVFPLPGRFWGEISGFRGRMRDTETQEPTVPHPESQFQRCLMPPQVQTKWVWLEGYCLSLTFLPPTRTHQVGFGGFGVRVLLRKCKGKWARLHAAFTLFKSWWL